MSSKACSLVVVYSARGREARTSGQGELTTMLGYVHTHVCASHTAESRLPRDPRPERKETIGSTDSKITSLKQTPKGGHQPERSLTLT